MMALIANGSTIYGGNPLAYGGVSFLTGMRSNWTNPGQMRGAFMTTPGEVVDTAGRPNGYQPPYTWLIPQTGGGLSAYNSITASESLAADLVMGQGVDAALVADGGITTADMGVVVACAATMVAAAAMNPSMDAVSQLVSTLAATGDLASAMQGLAWMVSNLVADGTTAGSDLFGTAEMSAELTTAGDVLTAAAVASAVWADVTGALAAANIELIRKTTGNRLEVDFTAQTLILYDDDGISVLRTWPLATDGGEGVATASGVQTKRGVPA